MNDLSPTITPKSDQLNADDLIAGPRTITVTQVLLTGAGDQPVAIRFQGDDNKPYKPCKSMRRLLIAVWGPDGNVYAGRAMTLFKDDSVMFGGEAVGGIRISHVSHIDQPVTIPLTVSRAKRKPYTVHPLRQQAPAPALSDEDRARLQAAASAAATMGTDALRRHWDSLGNAEKRALSPSMDDLKTVAAAADANPGFDDGADSAADDDGWPGPDTSARTDIGDDTLNPLM